MAMRAAQWLFACIVTLTIAQDELSPAETAAMEEEMLARLTPEERERHETFMAETQVHGGREHRSPHRAISRA